MALARQTEALQTPSQEGGVLHLLSKLHNTVKKRNEKEQVEAQNLEKKIVEIFEAKADTIEIEKLN
jgi:hypothetical protein